jgi:hypothetical protein
MADILNGNGSKLLTNLKTGGIAGAVIAAIASLGYAEIQREENDILLQNNTILVQMAQSESVACRNAIVKAYTRGSNDEVIRKNAEDSAVRPTRQQSKAAGIANEENRKIETINEH